MTPLVQVPAVPEQNTKGLAAIEQANAFDIDAPGARQALDNFCVSLKLLDKEIDLAYDEHIEAAYKAHKALVAKKKVYAEPNAAAYRIAKTKLIALDDRQKAEAEAAAAQARIKAKKDAEDAALARAAEAEEYGDDAGAAAIINAPVIVEPVKAYAAPKTATVFQTRWKFKITNAALIPREYLIPDETKIGGVIRATKGSITIPGVEAFSERC